MKENNKYYPEIEPSANFPKIEEDILKKWNIDLKKRSDFIN